MKSLVGCLFMTIALFVSTAMNGQTKIWSDVSETESLRNSGERLIVPEAYRAISAQRNDLRRLLSTASSNRDASKLPIIELPMPDGSNQAFYFYEASIMHPDLAAQFPEIQSYAGYAVDQSSTYIRFDWTVNGFHAMVLSNETPAIFIDPYFKNRQDLYVCYNKSDYGMKDWHRAFTCGLEGNSALSNATGMSENRRGGDCQLRKYRLALACTGEYATFHAGGVSGVMSEMNTAMTRVNGIYEREVGVTMEIISNNTALIYFNAGTDPYTNGAGGTMLGENQSNIDMVIGSANYDIGHVFSTGGGGIAALNSPCNNNRKARGVTGLGSPVGDPFYVDYVSHEMGHQFGANHSYNNSCSGNRNSSTAMEPGSGSTIMSYAGICSPNVQNFANDYFNAISLVEIYDNITNGVGSSCYQLVANGNNKPTAMAVGSNYDVPVRTPFELTGVGIDIDGDDLTYCWEQMDPEISTQPPAASSSDGPNFRTFNPSADSIRTFPNLASILMNQTPEWEVLPAVSRGMNFRLTVRDNHPNLGCTDEDDLSLQFHADAGPFIVTYPPAINVVTWLVGDFETIEWNVANTNLAPVSCSSVDIYLSDNGGQSFDYILAENVANDGEYQITVPNVVGNNMRVKIKGNDNVFFDISNRNFRIEIPDDPNVLINVSPNSITTCNTEEKTFELYLTPIAGFSEKVAATVTNFPSGLVFDLNKDTLQAPDTLVVTVSDMTAVPFGNHQLQINLKSVSVDINKTVFLNLYEPLSDVSLTALPSNYTEEVATQNVLLTWDSLLNAADYLVEVSKNPAFEPGDIVHSSTTVDNESLVDELNPFTVYYWRIRPSNICGAGSFSETFSFQTEDNGCLIFESADVPRDIISNGGTTITSSVTIPFEKLIQDLNVHVDITHTDVGDLTLSMFGPRGNFVQMFANECSGTQNIDVILDDEGSAFACSNNPALSGRMKPNATPLSNFDADTTSGLWLLIINDNAVGDGGTLNSWSLEVCTEAEDKAEITLVNNKILNVRQQQSEVIGSDLLSSVSTDLLASEVSYVLLTNPNEGLLSISGTPIQIGDSFTDQDVLDGLLAYEHGGGNADTDSFQFDVIGSNSVWNPGHTFNIAISAITANFVIAQQVLCHDGMDGAITLSGIGGQPPYTYSLNGIDFVSSSTFTNLGPASYTGYLLDSNGDVSQTSDIELLNPEEIILTIDVDRDSIRIFASGGTGTFEYSVNNGMMFSDDSTFYDLANDMYLIVVRDNNGCEKSDSALINVFGAAFNIVNRITCMDAADGSVDVVVSGGGSPYLYGIEGTGNSQPFGFFENLGPDTYRFWARDANSEFLLSDEITFTNPDSIRIEYVVNGNDFTVHASGGWGGFEYSIDGTMYTSDSMFVNIPDGVYDLYVRDAEGCIKIREIGVGSSGIGSFEEIGGVIKPNPAKDRFEIEINRPDLTLEKVEIYDVNGREIPIYLNLISGSKYEVISRADYTGMVLGKIISNKGSFGFRLILMGK